MKEMKWIEHIRVRSSPGALQEVLPSVAKQVADIEESVSDAETFFMRHAIYDGDLSVVIVWLGEQKPRKTVEGLMVAEQLQKMGSVDHAVWIPVKSSVEKSHSK